jgi:predicted AlkP superfamily phosphohydrolase/phosphomutase
VPHNGITVAGFLTPGIDAPFTYPPELADELHRRAGGEYLTDVPEFRTDDRDRLLKNLYTMVERRFRVAYDFLIHEPWDFFMMVEIGTDRLHHAFWNCCNADHPLYEPGNSYETVIPDFYRYLDTWIGSLLATLSDDTTVMVLSDHGSRNLLGGVRINEWLIRKGLLVLRDDPLSETPLTPDLVDWARTRVWSEGGYYARIFVNVTGREPSGTVDPSEYDAFLDQLANELQAIEDEHGRPMATRVLKPQAIYRACTNVPPDLIVYFDDLNRRSIGTVGTGKILSSGNDTGPDHANHDPEGILIMTRMADLRSGTRKDQRIDHATLLDIAPTILHELGSPVPDVMGGTVINRHEWETTDTVSAGAARRGQRTARPARVGATEGYTAEEEEIIRKRLEDLGYL